ncbi:hypothetical protein [Spirillospora sp. CA-294931]|uniref:hypothetical protein n=1 Tax=Spirillospora sp. CA-294931 TaxID=3240042 RepID=UPI003D8D8815
MDGSARIDELLDQADDAHTAARAAEEQAREALFDACAEAVKAGQSPEHIATRLKSRKTPEQLELGYGFTAAYIRRKVRERGVAGLPTGPKPRKERT